MIQKPMIHMCVDICVIDGLPKELSPAYLAIKNLYPEEAEQLVVEEVFPPVESHPK